MKNNVYKIGLMIAFSCVALPSYGVTVHVAAEPAQKAAVNQAQIDTVNKELHVAAEVEKEAPVHAQNAVAPTAAVSATPTPQPVETKTVPAPEKKPDVSQEVAPVETKVVREKPEVKAPQVKRYPRMWSVGTQISTLGLGGELVYRLTKNMRVRLVGQGFNYDTTLDRNDLDYDADITLFTAGPLVDYNVFGSHFRITAGALYNGNKIDASGTPNKDTKIGDNTYTPAEIGTITAKATYDDVAPYLGIGWGNTFQNSRLTLSFEAGVLYQGKADLDYSTNGALNSAAFQADIAKEVDEIQDKLDKLEYFPVVSIGVNYSF